MNHTSSKLIELGSTAFRQPRAESHCRFIHGYQLKAEINFACNELDNNNWVFDFGGLKDLKQIYNNQFDHTTCIAADDPALPIFEELVKADACDLRIMPTGTGIERIAEWCFKTADTFVEEATEGRVWVDSVTVYEHDNNFASYNRPTIKTEQPSTVPAKDIQPEKEAQEQAPPQDNPHAARVGPDVKRGGNFSDPFAGTSWGNK